MRKQKVIGSGQEASVRISTDPRTAPRGSIAGLLATLCIVSEVDIVGRPPGPGRRPARSRHGRKSPHAKCERCWNLRPTVGQDAEHPTLCDRCVRVVSESPAGP